MRQEHAPRQVRASRCCCVCGRAGLVVAVLTSFPLCPCGCGLLHGGGGGGAGYGLLPWRVPTHGFVVDAILSNVATDTHCWVMRRGPRVVLAFRGTNSPKNVRTDLNALLSTVEAGEASLAGRIPGVNLVLPQVHKVCSCAVAGSSCTLVVFSCWPRACARSFPALMLCCGFVCVCVWTGLLDGVQVNSTRPHVVCEQESGGGRASGAAVHNRSQPWRRTCHTCSV